VVKARRAGDEADVLLSAQERAESVLLLAQQTAEQILLTAKQEAEAVLLQQGATLGGGQRIPEAARVAIDDRVRAVRPLGVP
jgi:hypothetical protein